LTVRIASLVSGDVFAKPNMGSALAVLFGLMMITLMSIVGRKEKK
jgi:putative spermidine/putrescine transport system permease protein